MLNTYIEKLRPNAEVDAIIAATACFPERTLKKWQKITFADSEYVHVIVSGELELRRNSDELCILNIHRPCILGISTLYYDAELFSMMARSNVVVRSIKKDEFHRMIGEKDLWPALSNVLSWYICVMVKRDNVLVARNAYSVVREFLLEIHELITVHKRDINIYDYIQEYTNLARSTIIKILSDLKKGQYIVVEKGKLVSLNTLPERY